MNIVENRIRLLSAKGMENISWDKYGKKIVMCCPFHNERTPSCSVNLAEGIFFCFSCQSQGTLDELITQIEKGANGVKLTFKEVADKIVGDQKTISIKELAEDVKNMALKMLLEDISKRLSK